MDSQATFRVQVRIPVPGSSFFFFFFLLKKRKKKKKPPSLDVLPASAGLVAGARPEFFFLLSPLLDFYLRLPVSFLVPARSAPPPRCCLRGPVEHRAPVLEYRRSWFARVATNRVSSFARAVYQNYTRPRCHAREGSNRGAFFFFNRLRLIFTGVCWSRCWRPFRVLYLFFFLSPLQLVLTGACRSRRWRPPRVLFSSIALA